MEGVPVGMPSIAGTGDHRDDGEAQRSTSLMARPNRRVRVNHRRLIGHQRTCRGRFAAWPIWRGSS